MDPSSPNANRTMGNPYRQANVIFIILCLSFCSQATSTLESQHLSVFTLYSSPMAVPGLIMLIVLAERKGRRLLLISLFLLFIISLFFRIFLPVVQAATMFLAPVALCEYTSPKFRMALLIVNFAVLRISSWLTTSVYWMREFELFNFGLAIGCIFSVMTWPESPYWLASKKRFGESKQEFLSLRGEDSRSKDELQALLEETPRHGSSKMFYAPLLVAFPVLFTSSYLSYLEDMLGIARDKLQYAIIVNIICALVTALISLKLSRRIYFLSSAAILFMLLMLGCLFYYFDDGYIQVEIVLTLVSYVLITCGPIGIFVPILIEIIPQKYVSIMSAFIGCAHCFIHDFIDLFSGLLNANFPILCLSVILTFVSAYFFLPEAKDKTLLEIEHLYLPKTNNNKSLIKTDL